jgi:hypothetical protein
LEKIKDNFKMKKNPDILNDFEMRVAYCADIIEREAMHPQLHHDNILRVKTVMGKMPDIDSKKRVSAERDAVMRTDNLVFAVNDREVVCMEEIWSYLSPESDEITFAYNGAITGAKFWIDFIKDRDIAPSIRRMALSRWMSFDSLQRVIETPVLFKGRS